MARMQKVGLLAIFTIGCATPITSILRLVTLIPSLTTADPTYPIEEPQIWINVESNLIVICPCLPFLRQFMWCHAPGWMNQAGSTAQSYLKVYSSGTATRSRRKEGITRLQDDNHLVETPRSRNSETGIVKEVEWEVNEEPKWGPSDATTLPPAQHTIHAV
ncbi:unnamed protein product [Penicillium pancosmium]